VISLPLELNIFLMMEVLFKMLMVRIPVLVLFLLQKKEKKESSLIPKLPGGKKKKDAATTSDKEKKPTTSTSPSSPAPPPSPPASSSPPEPLPVNQPHHNDNDSSDGEERPHNGQQNSIIFNPPKQLLTIYAYDATEENEISFAEGDTIYLLEKDDSGWWRGRNLKGQEGLFPSNFVEVVGEEANSGSIEIHKDFRVLYDYEAEDETELTIKEGEILHVISQTDGWYFGSNSQGQEGNFPSNFVEIVGWTS